MIKEQNKVFKKVQLISDLSLVTVSFFIGYLLRNEIVHIYPFMLLKDYLKAETLGQISYYIVYIGLLPVLLLIWGGLLSYFGMYKSVGVTRITEALFIILKTTVVGFILFGSYVFILRIQHDVSRLFIGFTFAISAVLISCEKILLVFAFKAVRRRNKSFKSALLVFTRVLVVGTNKRARYFLKQINANPDLGVKVVGIIDIIPDHKGKLVYGHEIIGSINDIPEIITKEVIDEIVFIVPRSWITKIEEIMLYCESAGLKVNLAVDLFDLKLSKARQTDIFGLPLLAFESTKFK